MIFRDADCAIVPVVEDGKPVGVLTDRDVALAVGEYPDLPSLAVTDLMSRGVVSVALATPIPAVLAKFGKVEVVRRLRLVVARLTGGGGRAPSAKEQVPGAVDHGL